MLQAGGDEHPKVVARGGGDVLIKRARNGWEKYSTDYRTEGRGRSSRKQNLLGQAKARA